jgi:B12-binding domain/radical SAM domain protein
VVRGEAEETFPRVLKMLADGSDAQSIPGIAFRSDEEVVLTPPGSSVPIDRFPSFSWKRGMFGPIEITRGCPFACSFCQTSHIFGVRPRHRSVDAVVEHAETIRTRKGRVVRLLSPNAFSYGSPDGRSVHAKALEELLDALRRTMTRRGKIIFGYFPSEVRPEHVTPETLGLLRKYADNDEIVIGAQSGSPRMLDACHRSHSVESVLSAVSHARRFGFKVIVDFMFGLPGERPEDERRTVVVMTELCRLGARIHPHAFVPLPQTAFSRKRPGRISGEVVRTLDRLAAEGAIYGDWIRQRRLAGRVYRQGRSLEE